MAFFYSATAMRELASSETIRRFGAYTGTTLTAALNEAVTDKFPSQVITFDIFLSYKWDDRDIAMGIYKDLVRRGYLVYMDRIMDPHLSRETVSVDTVETLRKRLMQSKSLFYAMTENSSASSWMPWELGFEDGYRGKSAIVPVTDNNTFTGVEFVAVYPRVFPVANALGLVKPNGEFLAVFESWRDSIPERKCGMPTCPIPR